jgi:hypothetical protein
VESANGLMTEDPQVPAETTCHRNGRVAPRPHSPAWHDFRHRSPFEVQSGISVSFSLATFRQKAKLQIKFEKKKILRFLVSSSEEKKG